MSYSTSEVGHAKNIANFEELISYCTGYGARYSPTNADIEVAGLNTKLASAQAAHSSVLNSGAAFKLQTNKRKEEFKNIKKLSTRIMNALAVSGADKQAVADARTINKKIQGTAANPKTNELEEGQETKETRSTSEQSYDKILDHFESLLTFLTQVPEYAPNENDLKLTSLQTKLTAMKTENTRHIDSVTALSNETIARNRELYDEETGLVPRAKMVKQYVKSIYGSSSPEYRQVNGIRFRDIS